MILDPACGSGTFLIEYLKKQKLSKKITVYGIDKNPRMLLLADLNIGHYPKVNFKKKLTDSIKVNSNDNKFDTILTNPPFGVTVDARDYDFSNLNTCKDIKGYSLKKQSSEIVFIEKCLQMLKPGGNLAIVIPKSIATNSSLSTARKYLGDYGYVYGLMNLPPETFASTGTQTSTLVLFIKKYKDENECKEPSIVALANIKNVGFDSTGRDKEGTQLTSFSKIMNEAIKTNKSKEYVSIIELPNKKSSFELLESFFILKSSIKGPKLSELSEYIGTGRTPARKDYSESGNFLIKVGNLSGSGINWNARDRNFITDHEVEKRSKSSKPLMLKKGDIVLTSSAHSPVYIAKKSDIYLGPPAFIDSDNISFVGEVMLIRVDKSKISPFVLLAYLRSKSAINKIQNMVRGQTAHLHASDLGQLLIPEEIFNLKSKYAQVAKLLEKQANLSVKLNFILSEQARILDK